MGKKSKFLTSTILGGTAILATSALLSPKVRKELQKGTKKKMNDFSKQFPETTEFVKEKIASATHLLDILKENLNELRNGEPNSFSTSSEEVKEKPKEDIVFSIDDFVLKQDKE
ncbi:MAG: hypothetical protein LBT69_03725 [Lactobacillales bacterium]|jgi:gas vesicle protein|nr:hypothetical protein [Lactobacillales bacterium]